MLFLELLGLVGFAYVVINIGSKTKVPLRRIAVPLVLVCAVAYFLTPLFAPVVTWLMQVGSHMFH